MNLKAKKTTPSKDYLLWFAVILLAGVAIVGDFYFAHYALPLRIAGLLVLAVVALFVSLQTMAGKKIWDFFKQARLELKKVVWPARQETTQTTLMVVAMVGLVALLLWAIDSLLLWVIGKLTA